MANLFDSTNYPSYVPSELKKGDNWNWKNDSLGTDYDNSSFTLKYEFNLIDGSTNTHFQIVATNDGSNYKLRFHIQQLLIIQLANITGLQTSIVILAAELRLVKVLLQFKTITLPQHLQ